jgi:nitroreductase
MSDSQGFSRRHPADAVAWIAERRSVAVKRLGGPGPDARELDLILRAALPAPDHGALRPWRIVRCRAEGKARLAGLFVARKLERNPEATAAEIEREREKAERPPVLLAVIAAPRPSAKVPEPEQIAGAGAALQGALLAAYGLGFGAIMLSGDRCADPGVRAALGIGRTETLLGFISIGTIVAEPKAARRAERSEVLFDFDGEAIVPLDLDAD